MRPAVQRFSVAVLLLGLAACSDSEVPAGPSAPAVPSPARVVSLRVSGPGSFFQRSQVAQLSAIATLSNGFTEDRTNSSTWQSSNSGVASVTSNGVVTVGDEGDANITASNEGQQATMAVRVRYAFRTPDPPPGQRIPKPNELGFVAQLMASRPDLVARSCQDQGGTWELMDFIVDQLRAQKDLRWGYNGRRGDVNFPARDELAYHWGSGPDELSRDTYAWDIIGGHCGPAPTPTWQDLSDLGTVWLSRGRF
jgi:Bacterial Ig-like domain (group 2)